MPEVQEVFRMSTQQVKPDPGALERQLNRQRRRSVARKLGAFAVAVAVVVVGIAVFALTRPTTSTMPGSSDSGAPSVPSGSSPFLLDLSTGATTPLPVELAGGYAYVASPDGTRLLYGAKSGGGCAVAASTKIGTLDGSDVQTLFTPGRNVICGARWSPDGSSLVYQLRDGASPDDVGNLFVMNVATGTTTQITHLELKRAWWWYLSPSFAPFTHDVIFQLPRGSAKETGWDVWSVSPEGGEPKLVLRNAAFPIMNPHPGPEGYQMAFVEPTATSFSGPSLMSARATPQNDLRSEMARANGKIWWPTMSPDGNRIAYMDQGAIYVIEFGASAPTKVARGETAEWLNTHTLIVVP
jgi:Tol biopolymer transport system component